MQNVILTKNMIM